MAETTIRDYLLWLVMNQVRLNEFFEDPAKALKDSGLPANKQKIMRDRNLQEILQAVHEEYGGEGIGDHLTIP